MVKDKNKGSPKDMWKETVRAMSLGRDLALPIFIGVLGGYFLDKWLGTVYVFTIGLLVAGIAIGYYNIARFIQKLNKSSEQPPSKTSNHNSGSNKPDNPGSCQ